MRGEAPIAPAVASKLLDALRTGGLPTRGQGAAPVEDSTLTRRESEILELVANGLSNKEIANELSITEGTVKNHVHNSLEKLHLTNRVQAAAYAVRKGMRAPEATAD
jgi:two-component system, NarL family, nitrate/nitrite response regulator NarL